MGEQQESENGKSKRKWRERERSVGREEKWYIKRNRKRKGRDRLNQGERKSREERKARMKRKVRGRTKGRWRRKGRSIPFLVPM